MNIRRQTGTNFKQGKAERGTAAGLSHMRRVKSLPCVICHRPPPSDAHHVFCGRYGQSRASDFDTIPLCKAHHQNGPEAIHQNKRQWQERHGPDHSYLEIVKEWLAELE